MVAESRFVIVRLTDVYLRGLNLDRSAMQLLARELRRGVASGAAAFTPAETWNAVADDIDRRARYVADYAPPPLTPGAVREPARPARQDLHRSWEPPSMTTATQIGRMLVDGQLSPLLARCRDRRGELDVSLLTIAFQALFPGFQPHDVHAGCDIALEMMVTDLQSVTQGH